MLLARFDYNNLRMMAAFDVLGLSDPLGGHSLRMMQNLVANLVIIQTIDELFWYFHKRLQCKLSLPGTISTFRNLVEMMKARHVTTSATLKIFTGEIEADTAAK